MRTTVWMEADVGLLQAALGPELEDGPRDTIVAIADDGGRACLTIEAPDVATLRAATRGTLRLIDAALRVAQSGHPNP